MVSSINSFTKCLLRFKGLRFLARQRIFFVRLPRVQVQLSIQDQSNKISTRV